MKIAVPENRNWEKPKELLEVLNTFNAMGVEQIQFVGSIDETEWNEEKCAVFDFDAKHGILYILVHNNSVISFFRNEE